MTSFDIPQCDLKAGYLAYRDAIDEAIRRVMESGWYILGREVGAFEAEFAAFTGTAHAVGLASGTAALALALRAVGVGPGDRVATVSHTAVATVAAIELIGAEAVLVDVDAFHGMDPESLEAALAAAGGRVKAVVPVHLYGQPVDMAAVMAVAARHGTVVVEDCSQAHGATVDGRPVGSLGAVGIFSLYPTKNLGAFGDGGVAVTNDPALADRLMALRQYGWRDRYISAHPGDNSRLDEVQAAILRVKLRQLAADNARRQAIAAAYDEALAGRAAQGPARRPNTTHVFHQYVLACDDRDGLRDRLKARGVGTNIHYPVPVHRQPAYEGRVTLAPGGLPVTERAAGRILSLPMFPQLDRDQVARVTAALRAELPAA